MQNKTSEIHDDEDNGPCSLSKWTSCPGKNGQNFAASISNLSADFWGYSSLVFFTLSRNGGENSSKRRLVIFTPILSIYNNIIASLCGKKNSFLSAPKMTLLFFLCLIHSFLYSIVYSLITIHSTIHHRELHPVHM